MTNCPVDVTMAFSSCPSPRLNLYQASANPHESNKGKRITQHQLTRFMHIGELRTVQV
jgi:hypothetical protein